LPKTRRYATDRCARSLGFLTTPYDALKVLVRSPMDGVVIGHTTNPLVFQGDALSHVAS
jgi:uncharacterized protein